MKLTVVGCASGMPSPNRAHSCYVIDTVGSMYMFDCGDGAVSALIRCGIDTSRIGDIFISHTHPDHVIGIPMFIQMEHLRRRTEPLRIHVPSEFETTFLDMLRGLYLFPDKMCFEILVRGIDDDFEFDDGIVHVKAHPNSHLAGNSEFAKSEETRNRMQCHSFTLISHGRKFAYSADIAGIEDLKQISGSADLLLTEGMHIDLTGLPDLLSNEGVKHCILTHLPDDFDRDHIIRYFEKAGYGSLDFAQEGLTAEI